MNPALWKVSSIGLMTTFGLADEREKPNPSRCLFSGKITTCPQPADNLSQTTSCASLKEEIDAIFFLACLSFKERLWECIPPTLETSSIMTLTSGKEG